MREKTTGGKRITVERVRIKREREEENVGEDARWYKETGERGVDKKNEEATRTVEGMPSDERRRAAARGSSPLPEDPPALPRLCPRAV